MGTTVYDTHCHIFNGLILKDLVHPPMATGPGAKAMAVRGWLNYMKEVAQILVDSQETNNKFVLTNLKEAFPGADNYATVPLMMDINYMHNSPLKLGQKVASKPVVWEDNILKQITELQELSKAGNCYPFLAIDPRRPGAIDAILDGQFVTKKAGNFFGIKLYPRLGYHPMAGKLPLLYAYCAKNNIPITSHCSAAGFPPWKTPSGKFTNPENFRPALEANPDLIINFAHFGTTNLDWGKTIIDLMKKYPNVYSDLSCKTGDAELTTFKNIYWNDDPKDIVKQRTLYGSDFDVFYFTKAGMDMDEYIKSFKDEFNSDELNNMMSVLPPKFLAL